MQCSSMNFLGQQLHGPRIGQARVQPGVGHVVGPGQRLYDLGLAAEPQLDDDLTEQPPVAGLFLRRQGLGELLRAQEVPFEQHVAHSFRFCCQCHGQTTQLRSAPSRRPTAATGAIHTTVSPR